MATVTATRAANANVARLHETGEFVEVSGYTTATTDSGDIIKVVNVPAGVTVLSVDLYHDDLGAGVTAAVGDADVSNYYHSGVDVSAAGRSATSAKPKTYATAGTIKITIGGANATDAKVIGVVVRMTREAVSISA